MCVPGSNLASSQVVLFSHEVEGLTWALFPPIMNSYLCGEVSGFDRSSFLSGWVWSCGGGGCWERGGAGGIVVGIGRDEGCGVVAGSGEGA